MNGARTVPVDVFTAAESVAYGVLLRVQEPAGRDDGGYRRPRRYEADSSTGADDGSNGLTSVAGGGGLAEAALSWAASGVAASTMLAAHAVIIGADSDMLGTGHPADMIEMVRHYGLDSDPLVRNELGEPTPINDRVPVLRGGAFKPRTSPFAFKGLGREALEILAEARFAAQGRSIYPDAPR